MPDSSLSPSDNRVLLDPDDVLVVYTRDGELVGYAVERSLLQPARILNEAEIQREIADDQTWTNHA